MATFSYDPSTDIGKVRLYVPGETDPTTALLTDDEISAFLSVQSGEVRLAAADALDMIGTSTAKVQQKIKLLNLELDGPAVARVYQENAKRLRDRVDEAPVFDWAEQVTNAFSERERYLKQFLRGQI